MAKIILVVPPFHTGLFPSYSVELLKSVLQGENLTASLTYANLLFKKGIDGAFYEKICFENWTALTGEYLFAPFAHPRSIDQNTIERHLSSHENGFAAFMDPDDILEYTQYFLRFCVTAILNEKPAIVGFSSNYNDINACIALAAMLKQADSSIITIMGGTNCRGERGRALAQLTDTIDHIFQGESENALTTFCREYLSSGTLPRDRLITASFQENLNTLPIPDYTDFYSQLESHGLPAPQHLLFESSRGCWWANRKPCLFCGQHEDGTPYRTKSPGSIQRELNTHQAKNKTAQLYATDLIIPPEFTQAQDDIEKANIAYQLKPLMNFNELKILKGRGMNYCQAGIESLSTNLLTIMNKGATFTNNIQFLRNARSLDIQVYWNYLFNIPGEKPADYESIIAIIPQLHHLTPPSKLMPITIQKNSPLYNNYKKHQVKNLKPLKHYYNVFPNTISNSTNIKALALFFTGEYPTAFDNQSLKEAFLTALQQWQALHRSIPPVLQLLKDYDNTYRIKDTRPCAKDRSKILTEEEREVLISLRQPKNADQFKKHEVLQSLLDSQYIIECDNQYLSLVTEPNHT